PAPNWIFTSSCSSAPRWRWAATTRTSWLLAVAGAATRAAASASTVQGRTLDIRLLLEEPGRGFRLGLGRGNLRLRARAGEEHGAEADRHGGPGQHHGEELQEPVQEVEPRPGHL